MKNKSFLLLPLFLLGVENTLSKKLPPPPKPFERPINLVKLDLKKPELDRIIREMGKEKGNSLKKMELDIEEVELSIKRLFLEEPVNWEKIQKENEKISLIEAKIKTEIQKFLWEKEKEKPVPPPISEPKEIVPPQPPKVKP